MLVTGQISFGGTGTETGVFRINIGSITTKVYAQASAFSVFKVGTIAGQPGSMTIAGGTNLLYFKKDDSSTVADITGTLLGGATSGRIVIIRGSGIYDISGWDEYEAVGTGVATAERAGLVSRQASGTFNAAISGALTGTVAIDWSITGNVVILRIGSIGNTASVVAASANIDISALPSYLFPANPSDHVMRAVISNSSILTVLGLNVTNKRLEIFASAGGAAWVVHATNRWNNNILVWNI